MISNCGIPGAGYKPWSGTRNPNVPAGNPNRNTNGQYYGYDGWWPYYIGPARLEAGTLRRGLARGC